MSLNAVIVRGVPKGRISLVLCFSYLIVISVLPTHSTITLFSHLSEITPCSFFTYSFGAMNTMFWCHAWSDRALRVEDAVCHALVLAYYLMYCTPSLLPGIK